MSSKQVDLTGSLSFTLTCELSDIEDREVPYSRAHAMYSPDFLVLKLSSTSRENGQLPRYQDLHVDMVTITGGKRKSDGTPGKAVVREVLHYPKEYPSWVQEIVNEAIAQLKEEAR
jgi:hypothetical protein